MTKYLVLLGLLLTGAWTALGAQTFVTFNASIPYDTIGPQLNSTGSTANAADEGAGTVGRVWLATGEGTSKTCSAAGTCGFVWETAGAATFASGSTTISVGLLDLNLATGLDDGTFDVSADLVGGVDTIANGVNFHDADNGTKTVAHGDLIVFKVLMTARGGTDAISIQQCIRGAEGTGNGLPYGLSDTGTLAKDSEHVCFLIRFDDGTWGWITNAEMRTRIAQGPTGSATAAINTGTTPDEYCAIATLPFNATINGFGAYLSAIVAGDDFEMLLYSDPEGTPSVERTFTADPDQLVTGNVIRATFAPFDLEDGDPYGYCVRPTTANSISYHYFDAVDSSAAPGLKATNIFTTLKVSTRSNQTGAFSETNAVHLPILQVNFTRFISDTYTPGGATPVPMILSKRLPKTVSGPKYWRF